jgi:hypothetical protein
MAHITVCIVLDLLNCHGCLMPVSINGTLQPVVAPIEMYAGSLEWTFVDVVVAWISWIAGSFL